MKGKTVERYAECDVCGKRELWDPQDALAPFRAHKMMIVSVWDDEFDPYQVPSVRYRPGGADVTPRRYFDICSMECLGEFSKWSQARLRGEEGE